MIQPLSGREAVVLLDKSRFPVEGRRFSVEGRRVPALTFVRRTGLAEHIVDYDDRPFESQPKRFQCQPKAFRGTISRFCPCCIRMVHRSGRNLVGIWPVCCVGEKSVLAVGGDGHSTEFVRLGVFCDPLGGGPWGQSIEVAGFAKW